MGARHSAGLQLDAEDHYSQPHQGPFHPYITCCSLCNPRLLPAEVEFQKQSRLGRGLNREQTHSLALRVCGQLRTLPQPEEEKAGAPQGRVGGYLFSRGQGLQSPRLVECPNGVPEVSLKGRGGEETGGHGGQG